MNCPTCGNTNRDGVKFCTACGSALSEPGASEQPPSSQAPAQGATNEQAPVQASAQAPAPEQNPAPVVAPVLSAQAPSGQYAQGQQQYAASGQQSPYQGFSQQGAYGNQQPSFGHMPQQSHVQPGREPDSNLTFGNWMVTLLLMYIPIVNIIMLFIWAFNDTTPMAKRNFSRAYLVWMVIGIVLSIICTVVMGAAMVEMIDSIYDSGSYGAGSSFGYTI